MSSLPHWRCCPRRPLSSFAIWPATIVGGYLYVSGVLCGRANPLESGNGLWDFAVVRVLSPLFFHLGPRCNWQLDGTSIKEWLTRNGLFYVLPFFLALHWEYDGNALGAQFSLKAADLASLDSRAVVLLALGVAAIAGLLIVHLVWARRERMIVSYVGLLVGLPAAAAIVTRVPSNTAYLHVHHYNLGAFLFPLFRFGIRLSLAAQAVFLGLAIEGIARWGMDPLWYLLR